MLRRH